MKSTSIKINCNSNIKDNLSELTLDCSTIGYHIIRELRLQRIDLVIPF